MSVSDRLTRLVRAVERCEHLTLDGLANFSAAVLLDSKLLLESSTRKIWEGRPRSSAPKLERGSFGRVRGGSRERLAPPAELRESNLRPRALAAWCRLRNNTCWHDSRGNPREDRAGVTR